MAKNPVLPDVLPASFIDIYNILGQYVYSSKTPALPSFDPKTSNPPSSNLSQSITAVFKHYQPFRVDPDNLPHLIPTKASKLLFLSVFPHASRDHHKYRTDTKSGGRAALTKRKRPGELYTPPSGDNRYADSYKDYHLVYSDIFTRTTLRDFPQERRHFCGVGQLAFPFPRNVVCVRHFESIGGHGIERLIRKL